ncbi:hypothetical protein NL367_28150, partial [Klebsiella pneumoniae]|nr:hypothetical protein [Klebsiella pneumoniae]
PDKSFEVSDDVIAHSRKLRERGREAHEAWNVGFEAWKTANPEGAALLDRLVARDLPEGWADAIPTFEAGTSVATRAASGNVLSALAPVL